jgi:hypothetical protein
MMQSVGENSQSSFQRCDHCRDSFRTSAILYWRMKFCSLDCVAAYQQRLSPETKVKIEQLPVREELGLYSQAV